MVVQTQLHLRMQNLLLSREKAIEHLKQTYEPNEIGMTAVWHEQKFLFHAIWRFLLKWRVTYSIEQVLLLDEFQWHTN